MVWTDNGTEITCMHSYFMENDLIHHISMVHTPQQNGRVEHKHRHILNVARVLLFQANLPIHFWEKSVLTAGYLINRTPLSVLNWKTSFELLFHKIPPYSHLKSFGCFAYVHDYRLPKDKFRPRGRKCVFLGYPFAKKRWKFFNLQTNEFLTSRDAVFVEFRFRLFLRLGIIFNPLLWCNVILERWVSCYLRSGGAQIKFNSPTQKGGV